MHFPTPLLLLLTAAAPALAHYRFSKLLSSGQAQPEFSYIRQWQPIWNNSPVTDVRSGSLRCFGGVAAADVLRVSAGASVGFVADNTVGHPGPFTAYLARAPGDVTSFDGAGAVWFKIWEKGTVAGAALKFDDSSTQWTFDVPRNTPAGQYLLRFEHIALHGASQVGGAQFYVACAQIEVTGGGSGRPAPLVAIPGAYDASDPGIKINIYGQQTGAYKIPGPAVWSG